jgi:hypothetical protein
VHCCRQSQRVRRSSPCANPVGRRKMGTLALGGRLIRGRPRPQWTRNAFARPISGAGPLGFSFFSMCLYHQGKIISRCRCRCLRRSHVPSGAGAHCLCWTPLFDNYHFTEKVRRMTFADLSRFDFQNRNVVCRSTCAADHSGHDRLRPMILFSRLHR